MITITSLRWVPPRFQGLVRDLRLRWALEEAGVAYQARPVGRDDQASDAYRALQPFGQVPTFQDGDLTLFESGAVLLHLADRHPALAPADPAARAQMTSWMFAALNSVEPAVLGLAEVDLFFPDQDWAKARRPSAEAALRQRLAALAKALGERQHLAGDSFSVADILMVTVLRILRHTDLVAEQPALSAYMDRQQARPAFQKALADQMAGFVAPTPA